MVADGIGRIRLWQLLGQQYAEMFRGAVTASGVVTAGAAWLGVGKLWALVIGCAAIVVFQGVAILAGWLLWRFGVAQATTRHTLQMDEYQRRSLEVLEKIAHRLEWR